MAVQMFNYMWRYAVNLRSLYETPSFPEDESEVHDPAPVARKVAEARAAPAAPS